MTKRRSIISYDKLSIEQKKQILKEFPDGYINHLTTIKTPTGEVLDALIWDTDEIIYLVKIVKPKIKVKVISADNEDDFDDDLDKEDEIKDDDMDDEKDHDSDDEEDDYDKPDVDKDDDDDKD
jgi:DNA-directed RNA polymerase subunit delta